MVELKVRWHRNESSGIMDVQFLEGDIWVDWEESQFWEANKPDSGTFNGYFCFQRALKEGYEVVK